MHFYNKPVVLVIFLNSNCFQRHDTDQLKAQSWGGELKQTATPPPPPPPKKNNLCGHLLATLLSSVVTNKKCEFA